MQKMPIMVAVLLTAGMALAAGNIDDSNKYAWGENAGWQNWNPPSGDVTVTPNDADGYLSGHIWAENIGWIKLGDGTGPYLNDSATDWGVNLDAAGNLSGYAWGENVGWISVSNNYSQVTINTVSGEFSGYAWSENIGWLSLRGTVPDYGVRTTAYDVSVLPPVTVFTFR
jgi:hypothetical protein